MENSKSPSNESTTDRILFAAMQIISESGLKGLSASKLAAAADISKSTVFHHFKKMEDIPARILEKIYTDIIDPIQEDQYESVGAYLKVLGASSFPGNEQHIAIYKAFVSLFQASMYDSHLKEIVSTCNAQFGSMLYDKLRSLCSRNVDDASLRILSNLIFMSLDGIGMHYLVHGSQAKAQETWELFVDTIVKQYNLN